MPQTDNLDLQEWQGLVLQKGMRDGVIVRCSCGQPVALGMINDDPAVFHKIPQCRAFEDKEPDEYATYLRQMMTKAMGGDVGA